MRWPSRATENLIDLPRGTEDIVWLGKGMVLAAQGTRLVLWQTGETRVAHGSRPCRRQPHQHHAPGGEPRWKMAGPGRRPESRPVTGAIMGGSTCTRSVVGLTFVDTP